MASAKTTELPNHHAQLRGKISGKHMTKNTTMPQQKDEGR
jgi:hypothetical protein